METPGRRRATRKPVLQTILTESSTEQKRNASPNGKLQSANGYIDGNANGYASGRVNGKGKDVLPGDNDGYTNGNVNGLANGEVDGKPKVNAAVLNETRNPAIHDLGKYHFGAPLGILALMIGFLILMYYLYIRA